MKRHLLRLRTGEPPPRVFGCGPARPPANRLAKRKDGLSTHAYRLRNRRRYRSRCAQRLSMASRKPPAARRKRVFRGVRPWGARDVHFGLG